jgi:hypothetical protein
MYPEKAAVTIEVMGLEVVLTARNLYCINLQRVRDNNR